MFDFLFKTDQENLREAINALSVEDIESFCQESIYHRGSNYYDVGAVDEISYNGPDELSASVQGSQQYNVKVRLSDKQVYASCTCPYEDTCKHIVAVLLHALFEEVDHHDVSESVKAIFTDYLRKLSKNELISLVERFAPDDFRTVIGNQFVPEDQSSAIVSKVKKRVERVLDDESLYYEPSDMEYALENQLKKLDGLGAKEAETVYHLLSHIIQKVNAIINEGYLYNSYYDQPFDDSFITNFTRSFLKPLHLDQKTKYITDLEPVINDSDFGFFEGIIANLHELFEEKDLLALKDLLFEQVRHKDYNNIEAYYTAVESTLSLDEKSFILNRVHHLSASLSVRLAMIFEEQGQIKPAIEALEACGQKTDFLMVKNTVLNELLRLKQLDGSLNTAFADYMLTELPNKETLQLLITHFSDRKAPLEHILRQKAIYEMLDYLEEEKRMVEALEIILNQHVSEHTSYLFFKKYKHNFPEEAKRFLIKRIENNLLKTGNQYYERITDTLQVLKSIDLNKAEEIKAIIKRDYKRRTNLMAMLG